MTSIDGSVDERPGGMIQRVGLFLARFCSSAWIGAASLFVVVGVTEVTRGGFDAATKDTLVAIRFPAFYVFGVTLVGMALIGTCLAGRQKSLSQSFRVMAIIGLLAVLALMFVDYNWIYLPLLKLVTPPGQTRGANFTQYHESSKWINLAGLTICLIASVLLNWPSRRTER